MYFNITAIGRYSDCSANYLLMAVLALSLLLPGCENSNNGTSADKQAKTSSSQTSGNQESVVSNRGKQQSDKTWSMKTAAKEEGRSNTSNSRSSVQADRGHIQLVPVSDFAPGQAKVAITTPNPFADSPQAIQAGKEHFAAFNCAGCHAPKGGGGMGPPLSDNTWIYGEKPAQIYNSIVQGRPNGMPTFGAMLPEKVVWQLVAYVQTLNERKQSDQQQNFSVDVGSQKEKDAVRDKKKSGAQDKLHSGSRIE